MMEDKKLYRKVGKRYQAIDEYRDGFYGCPSNSLLYRHKSGFSCFLLKKHFNVNIDIKKLSFLQTKKDSIVLDVLKDDKFKVYNVSLQEFINKILIEISKK
jgi:hypothetical protein